MTPCLAGHSRYRGASSTEDWIEEGREKGGARWGGVEGGGRKGRRGAGRR